jgi:hypothetical protein
MHFGLSRSPPRGHYRNRHERRRARARITRWKGERPPVCTRQPLLSFREPASSVMNWRRLMPNIGFPPAVPPPVGLPHAQLDVEGLQVLGADLNCSESAADPSETYDALEECCTAEFQSAQCPLWVICDRAVGATPRCMSALPRKRTNKRSSRYVRLVPKAVIDRTHLPRARMADVGHSFLASISEIGSGSTAIMVPEMEPFGWRSFLPITS